jgi:hypothetical protein
MKYISIVFLFFISSILSAQNFENIWTDYFSYVSIKSISQGDDKIYAASENAVFTYDLSTNEIETISSVQGLSGELISTIHYSAENNLLVRGYENGLIEIVIEGEENILTVVDILDKQTIPPNRKRINHFNEYNGKLYIAAQFGISVYDLELLEFGDTYFIGDLGSQINITQTAVSGPHIFASSSNGGVRRANVDDDNLIDYEQWITLGNGNFKGVQALGEQVYVATDNNQILLFTSGVGFSNVANFSASIVDFNSFNDLLTITTTNNIQAYGLGFVLQASVNSLPDFEYVLQSGYSFNNNFYLGTTKVGMLEVPFGSMQANQILPDGPILNTPFAIDASPGQLWVAFGEVDIDFNPFFPNGQLSKRGISNLKEGAWTNISYDEIVDQVGKDATDLVQVAIDPNDVNTVYMTSYGKGLLKVVDQAPTVLYDESNTNNQLEITIAPNGDVEGIRLYGMDFDQQGNLWTVQSRRDEGLIKVTPNGQFQAIDVSSVTDGETESALSDVSISREGYVFFGATDSGMVGYNPTNNQFNVISKNAGSGNLPDNNVRSVTIDNNNRLWIGSLQGLRVLFNTSSFFEENANTDAQAIIILEDGVPQELLFEQSITDIEVDGSNNKWIATATSGVFYLSSNGQETLLRFTKENSPLPSNNVRDITIDSFTGVVYFATSNGLVAYNGTATAPRDNLENVYAFPNPVRPGFSGNVTIDGLTARANVKITDIEGNLVFEETSEGGSVLWDTTAFGRYRVASGVYLVLITTEDALETKISKIMVIR